MAGEIIGSVSIKVLPDTSEFRSEAQKKLTAIEKSLKDIEIKFKADFKDAVKDAAKARAAAEDAVKKAIRIRFDLDNATETQAQLKKVEQQLDAMRKRDVDVKVKLNQRDLQEARELLREHDNELFEDFRTLVTDKMQKTMKNLKLKPEIDSATFERKLDALYTKLEEKKLEVHPELSEREKYRLKREIESIEAEIQVQVGEASLRTAQLRFAWLGRTRIVTFVPNIDEAAAARVGAVLAGLTGARIFTNVFGGFRRVLTDIDKSVPAIMGWTLALTGLFAAVTTGLSNTVVALMDIARIAPAALALPGILGGMAIGIGSTVNAFSDWNDVFPTFEKNFDKLKEGMSANFWKGAAKPFRELANSLFPQFERNILRTNTALGKFFGNFAGSMVTVFDGELKAMFDDLNESIRIFGKYTDNVVGVLGKLGAVGAGNLPRLAEWFGSITKDFDEWLAKKGQKGLQEYVDRGIDRLKSLGVVIRETAQTFSGLAKAAEKAGGSTLASMANTMTKVSEKVNSADFQKNLVTALEGAHQSMENIAKKSGPAFKRMMEAVAGLMGDVLPVAGDSLGTILRGVFESVAEPSFQASVRGFFDNILESAENLEPGIKAVMDAATVLMDVLGEMGSNVSSLLGPALKAVNDVLQPIAAGFRAIPEPVRDIGIQLGIAVFAMKAFAGMLLTARAHVISFAASLSTTGALVSTFGKKALAVSGVAGVGGLLAMQQGAERSSEALSILGSTLSGLSLGALVGASFGPIGAVVGGATGALLGLVTGLTSSKTAFEDATPAAQTYVDTMNQVSGAITSATRSAIYDSAVRSDLFKLTDKEGLSRRTVIDGIVGEGNARKTLQSVISANMAEYDSLTEKMNTLKEESRTLAESMAGGAGARGGIPSGEAAARMEAIGKEITALDKKRQAEKAIADQLAGQIGVVQRDTAAIREKSAAVTQWSKVAKGVPKEIRSEFKAENIPASIRQVAKLANKYDLLPKQIKSVLQATGVEGTVKQVQKVRDKLTELKNTKPNLDQVPRAVQKATGNAAVEATAGGKKVTDNLKRETAKAKPDLKKFAGEIPKAIQPAAGAATSGGHLVGSNLKTAVILGFAGTAAALSASAASAVRAAIASARAAAGGAGGKGGGAGGGGGPSKMGDSFIAMLDAQAPAAMAAGGRFAARVLDGITQVFNTKFNASLDERFAELNNLMGVALEKSAQNIEARSDLVSKAQKALTKAENAADKAAGAAKKKRNKALIASTKAEAEAAKGAVAAAKKRVAAAKKQDKALQALMQQSIENLGVLRTKYQEAVQAFEAIKAEAESYREGIVSSIVAFADPSGLQTFDGIIRKLTDARNKAKQFTAGIRSLVDAGLNEETLQQLVSAGPEAGLAAVQAILSGGTAGVDMINGLMDDVNGAAGELGNVMVDRLFSQAMQEAANAITPLEEELSRLINRTLPQFVTAASSAVPQVTDQFSNLATEIKNATDRLREYVAVALQENDGGKGKKKSNKKEVKTAVAKGQNGLGVARVVNYYAADSGYSSDESLFAALDRARGW